MTGFALLAAEQQLPEDVGKAGPIGALLTVLLFIAILLLVDREQGQDGGHDTSAELRTPANRSCSGTVESTSERASS